MKIVLLLLGILAARSLIRYLRADEAQRIEILARWCGTSPEHPD